MSSLEAEQLLREHLEGMLPGDAVRAEAIEDIPGAWYITFTQDGRPLVGGAAYVVLPDTRDVFDLPASRPPFLNIRDVRELLDRE